MKIKIYTAQSLRYLLRATQFEEAFWDRVRRGTEGVRIDQNCATAAREQQPRLEPQIEAELPSRAQPQSQMYK